MKNDILQQHNSLTQARYDMTSAEKNVFYLLIAQIKNRGFNEKVYRISVRELAAIKGHEIDHIQFKATSKKLLTQVLSVPLQDGKFIEVSLLNSAEYVKRLGAIELELSKEIKNFLFELKNNFTQFSLQIGLQLKSKYAKRVYEMLCQYKDTGIMRISVEELKKRLWLINPRTGADKYPKYNLLKKKVLDVAQKELKERADIHFTYEVIKIDNKYAKFIFKIFNRTGTIITKDKTVEDTASSSHTFRKLVEKYKLSSWQAQKIIKEVPEKEIHKTIYDIQIDVLNNKVSNVGGYTAKVFDKKYNLEIFKNT